MTHEEAFLQSILENPDDDLPRMVYADWLTDRGETRGEFVHVQCLLARMAGDDPVRPQLEARERELLEAHQDDWLGPLGPLLSRWTFRRGFLDEVAVPAAVHLAHAPIAWPATVRRVEVDLQGFEVPAEVIEFVPESVAYENVILPIGLRGQALVVAMRDPRDAGMIEKLEFILNRGIEPVAAPKHELVEAICRHYGEPDPGGAEPDLAGCFVSPPPFPLDEVDFGSWDADSSKAARLLARLIATAIGRDAREVRVEPGPDRLRVRYDCDDGIAEEQVSPPRLLVPLVTRIRIAAGIWLLDQRAEQTGSFHLTVGGRQVGISVLVRRTDAGPAVVLTIASQAHGTARSKT